ncbi:hypothetical protein [Deefgea salmonis]|uniref:Nitrate/trimethylamine N-oxide reductase NapE/TorE n=1 Tax=Deefgea salmonis TaxID=2875502 RepID=A0ABS8BHL9_9NEIS|nr:hypothetical protein [Deefgea salmonis]MCB5195188.1 hypothetical protein [Deefgea salmonis]
MTEVTTEKSCKSEWKKLLLLAFVGLPIAMLGAIASYGLIVRLLQIFLIGLPGA